MPTLAPETVNQPAMRRPSAHIAEYGIYSVKEVDFVPEPYAPMGVTRRTADRRLVLPTDQIPLLLGTVFGFCYVAEGLAPGQPGVYMTTFQEVMAVLTKTVEHPPMSTPDGKVQTSFFATKTVRVIDGKVSECEGYTFDHPFELLAGKWRFTIGLGGQDLVAKEFLAR